MFGIGGFELFIIVVFAFVVFGPDKLPEVTKLAGMGIRKFRKAKAEMDKVLQEEIVDPVMKEANKPEEPKKKRSVKSASQSNTVNSNVKSKASKSDNVKSDNVESKNHNEDKKPSVKTGGKK